MIEMTTTDTPPAEEKQSHIVLPLFEIVVFPKTRTKIQVDKKTGEVLAQAMTDDDGAYAIGLTVRTCEKDTQDCSEDGLYTTGNLLKISAVQPADNGYLICAQAVRRVQGWDILKERRAAVCNQ